MNIRSSRGFTLIELLIVVAVIGIIASMAVPSLLRTRMSGNEASAIGSLRTLVSSQTAFASSCANGFYAANFTDLRGPSSGGAPFVSPDMLAAAPKKSGYDFTMLSGSEGVPGTFTACNGVTGPELASTYVARAIPQSPGTSGVRYFWTNTLGTIYFDPAATIGHTDGSTPPAVSAPAGPVE